MLFHHDEIRKRVALFGGSFNPPHKGHTAICKWLFAKGQVDEVWVIPCFIHPFGKELLPFEDRLAMCKIALGKLDLNVKVIDVERELGGVSYSKRTIEHLKREHPDIRFMLVTGDDANAQMNEWNEFDAICDMVEVVRVPRGNASPIPDVSSTEVRHKIMMREPYSDLIEKEVAVYIITKGLFK